MMNHTYYLYCRVATVAFAINTVYPVTVKLFQQRLAEDWVHSVLHVCSGVLAAYATWHASNVTPAKLFTWGIAVLYLVLGLYGWCTPGLFLNTRFAIPLGVADNLFHLMLSVSALITIAVDAVAFRRYGSAL